MPIKRSTPTTNTGHRSENHGEGKKNKKNAKIANRKKEPQIVVVKGIRACRHTITLRFPPRTDPYAPGVMPPDFGPCKACDRISA